MVDNKAVLDWCFVIGSLNLGVFGFLYSAYASAKFASKDSPILGYIRNFCRVLAGILAVLVGLSVYIAYGSGFGFPAWIVVICMIVVAAFAIGLAFKME